MLIVQEPEPGSSDTQFRIEFDEYERNRFVGRLLDVFKSDLSEQEMCEQAYRIHLEICTQHDLYVAVWSKLAWNQKETIRIYVAHRGALPEGYTRPHPKKEA